MVISLKKTSLGALLAAAVLTGCTSGNAGIEPPVKTVVNPLSGTLKFAVGTATYDLTGVGASVVNGLNVVTSYRQANGLSAVLASTPAIVGPTGFTVPAAAPAVDAGTASITGTSQLAVPGSAAAGSATTFTQAGGVFAYGILPANSTNQASSGSNTGSNYSEPFYADAIFAPAAGSDQTTYLGGPPAFINSQDGTYPGSFKGFGLGFNSFANTTLPVGTYTLNLGIPTGPTTIGTVTGTATLATNAALGVYTAPAFAADGTGGGTVTFAVPPRVLETVIVITDKAGKGCNSGPYYTLVDHTPGPGAGTVTLPDMVGKITNGTPNTSVCKGDKIKVYAIGADYRLYEAAVGQDPKFPGSDATGASASPALFFAGGPTQADITVSAPAAFTI